MLRKRLDGSPSARAASLSAAVPGTAGPCGPSTAHARSAAIKVLLVDDSDDLRLLVARALHRRGHQVDAFADAESAWEACQQTAYPLIILDWMLPGMDGLELCRRIRRLPWADSALVLVMTANDQPEHLQAALEAGADDYLAKPFDLRLLDVRLTIAERQVEVPAARKRAEEALREQALLDPLTGLPNRLLLREALLPLGAEVSLAASGGEGLRMARQAMEAGQPFRLVLLDGRMPDLSGFEVAERLKRDGRGAERTILMLTSDASQEDLARVRALGLGGYLLKPLKRSDLLVAIARLAAEQVPAAERSAVEAAASAPLAPADERRPARLLLVEDTRDNQLLVKAFLRRLPLEVDVAENGREAVELFRGRSYDLVLMDMLLPEMDGLEATRAIRAWEQAQGRAPTPIIALTASAMASDVEAALAAGCTAHLAKPVKRATLLEAITTYLGGTSA